MSQSSLSNWLNNKYRGKVDFSALVGVWISERAGRHDQGECPHCKERERRDDGAGVFDMHTHEQQYWLQSIRWRYGGAHGPEEVGNRGAQRGVRWRVERKQGGTAGRREG